MRGVGDRIVPVSRVAVLTGYVDVPACAAATRDPQVDAVIAGDACEWEGTEVPQGRGGLGRKFGVLYAGFAATERPGTAVDGALAPVRTAGTRRLSDLRSRAPPVSPDGGSLPS